MRFLKRVDWFLLLPVLILNFLGLIVFLSLSQATGVFEYMRTVPQKHIIFVGLSLILFFVVLYLPYEWIFTYRTVVLLNIVIIGLLILALVLPPYAQTHRWINLGPVLIQPSEFYKIAGILLVALALSQRRFKLLLLILIALSLILLSPDLGMFILQLAVFLIMLLYWISQTFPTLSQALLLSALATVVIILGATLHPVFWGAIILLILWGYKQMGIKPLLISTLLLGGLVLIIYSLPVIYELPFLLPYQKERLEPFVKQIQEKGILALLEMKVENFHTRQALIALGSGGIFGKGISGTTQSRLRFLPEAESDFMYATLSEMFGLVGAGIVILLYGAIVARLTYLLNRLTEISTLEQLVLIGVTTLIILEVIWGIGINLALLPTKGLPLPFLAYGGSSLVTHYILLGLVNQIYYNNRNQLV